MISDEQDMKCGCGKQGKYIDVGSGKMSCNKYKRCPTYDELSDSYRDLMNDFKESLRSGQALVCYKEISQFYKEAESTLERLAKKNITLGGYYDTTN